MTDLLGELGKMTPGQWVADLATMFVMGLMILFIWLVWVRPFEARVARELAAMAAERDADEREHWNELRLDYAQTGKHHLREGR